MPGIICEKNNGVFTKINMYRNNVRNIEQYLHLFIQKFKNKNI